MPGPADTVDHLGVGVIVVVMHTVLLRHLAKSAELNLALLRFERNLARWYRARCLAGNLARCLRCRRRGGLAGGEPLAHLVGGVADPVDLAAQYLFATLFCRVLVVRQEIAQQLELLLLLSRQIVSGQQLQALDGMQCGPVQYGCRPELIARTLRAWLVRRLIGVNHRAVETRRDGLTELPTVER